MEYQNDYFLDSENQVKRSWSKIIPFPVHGAVNIKPRGKIILGQPGEDIPDSIPDFRPYLQRDGLILLSWEKRLSRNGALYTAYWVTSSGILRYYASHPLFLEDFMDATPCRKSYAAEDGIDFYGEESPFYMVHVAPELMMSSRMKIQERPAHIKRLKQLGIKADFNYSFILTREKKLQRLYDNKKHA